MAFTTIPILLKRVRSSYTDGFFSGILLASQIWLAVHFISEGQHFWYLLVPPWMGVIAYRSWRSHKDDCDDLSKRLYSSQSDPGRDDLPTV